ncbi:MAG: signal recognition particle subunit [Bogoriella megaspora]|nr:MAG: signal recognition particle subunit [Bogoriella megaspora]
MSRNARIEEVSDSDPEDMDPSDFDPGSSLPYRPAAASSPLMNPSAIPATTPSSSRPGQPAYDPQKSKHYHCLYPIYFDANRSCAQGRRVSKELAVANPLARTIVDAVAGMGLSVVFEPGKTHPKDWANPGRVRVLLKQQDEPWSKGRMGVRNKHHLYRLVSQHLKSHPTTAEDPLRVRVPGLPLPEDGKAPKAPGVPKGWKMGDVLPLHSAAVTGGGVSENVLKDMMAEMQGQPRPSQIEGDSGGGKKKKDKKGKAKG